MRCCVCLFQQSLQCSPSKMAAGESNSRSSCLNLSNSGPLGNAPPSNSAHSSPASNGGSMGAVGGINRSAGNSNPQSGPENGGGAETAVRSTPSAQNPSRQSVGQSGATSGAASNMTATSSSSSSSASTASADASAAVPSLPSSPASVLVYREPVYNWQATKSTVKERFALAVGSAVFDAMFNGGMATTSTEIELPDVEPAAFLALLKFLYSDEVQIGPETVMTTLYTAKKYAVPALEAHCVEFLKKNLRADNAFMLLTQARLFDEPQLASLCLENIDKNTADALAAEGFTDIDLDTLVAVLERDTLGVREVRLFGAAVRWADAEAQRQQLQPTPENKRRVLGKALSLIRFPLMTIEEFAAGPAQSGILTDREVVSLFLHFTVNPKPHVEFIDRPRCCLRGKECSITRFSQVESRWGYSGTSDRIRFSVNRRIFVVGFGLYGSIHGPTDYQVNIQIIHTDSNTVLGQNDTGFSCDGTASTFRVMFKEPVEILPSVNYIACATLKGPDSHYGTKGMRKVTHEAPATGTKTCFTFCYAAGNNNGTSVEDGQIPEVIFYT
ncbi:BTB/POZ domain-containing protein 2a isoform X2 [Megalobrama amblycephala]|uniref:BTB/POZ domain-containing protein 2a isoform X2 n=1 Tax=Megalobrama amblycephala TaxID=75352 RepID=UPI002014817F|nr:BTB/POZ domain-containing protein 2a isoform X2 [Megalobrama amblycephala]XP_051764575.1 BTB/POZ domain-containing protein 2a isoform X2 [Ctenopharyngodon idella]